MKYYLIFFLLFLIGFNGLAQKKNSPKLENEPEIKLLLRCDDVGMCHAVNMATQKMLATGLPFSASVMFACPWYQEAVQILKNQPQVAVGIHLTLGSEWKSYKWGPISGRNLVPGLTDSLGYFYPTPGALIAAKPSLAQIETEFRSQIERALKSGLKITYLDNHMGAGLYSEEQKALLQKLANEYKLGISGFLGEVKVAVPSRYPLAVQPDSLGAALKRLKPGAPTLMVFHLGLDVPEMQALQDSNAGGTPEMSKQRQLELDMLTSPAFRELLKSRNIKLISYADLLAEASSPALLKSPEKKSITRSKNLKN